MPGSAQVNANILKWVASSFGAAEMCMSRFGMRSADWAKTNHKWDNVTGLAEGNLGSWTTRGSSQINTDVYQGMTWSVYLETRTYQQKGFLGVLDDAILQNLPSLVADLQSIFGMGYGIISGKNVAGTGYSSLM